MRYTQQSPEAIAPGDLVTDHTGRDFYALDYAAYMENLQAWSVLGYFPGKPFPRYFDIDDGTLVTIEFEDSDYE